MVANIATMLGYAIEKRARREHYRIVKGRDVFVSFPTRFGKSLCYILLPSVFDQLRKVERKSIALVEFPL